MALSSEVPLTCKWPLQTQTSRQSWLLRICFSENSLRKIVGFFHKNQPELCFPLFISCTLHSILVPPLQKRAVGDFICWGGGNPGIKVTNWACCGRLCLSYFVCMSLLMSESCSASAVHIPVNKGQCRLQWTLAAGKMGLFSGHSVNCAVWHTQVFTGFLKGALKCTVLHEQERDVASNYLCAVFILVIRSLTGTQLYISLLFSP